MKKTLGINTFVWASPFSTETDTALIEKAARMGFDVFEVAGEDPKTIDAVKLKMLLDSQKLGTVICGVFGPDRDLSSADRAIQENGKAYLRWCIDTAHTVGSAVVAGPMYGAVGKTPALNEAERQIQRHRSIENLREIADYASKVSIKLAIEVLNRFETDLVNTAQQALDFVTQVGRANIGLHLDTFHMHIEEQDSAAAIRLAGTRLFHFHASENDRGIPGTGQVNWQGVAAALRDIHYEGAVVIEAFTPEVKSIARAVSLWRPLAPDQDTLARQGLAFLRELL
jgi:D-psicose/D-tagatose/L-ribulose 3-epimerase